MAPTMSNRRGLNHPAVLWAAASPSLWHRRSLTTYTIQGRLFANVLAMLNLRVNLNKGTIDKTTSRHSPPPVGHRGSRRIYATYVAHEKPQQRVSS